MVLSEIKLTMLQSFKRILKNLEGHLNRITGSKVTAIFLNGEILPICLVALGRVCAQPVKQAC